MIGTVEEISRYLFQLDRNKKYQISEYKEKKKGRSLNANNYAWVLMQELADKLGITKEEIYIKYIREKGIFKAITINNDAVSTFIHIWENKGLGWVCDVISRNNITTDLIAYYGSSVYNTKQMANFINYITEEAKIQDIEVKTPQEIHSLLESWNNGN